MDTMAPFFAKMIMQEADKSLEAGQAKYRAYFIKLKLYNKWQADTDAILIVEGYGDCIVSE